MPTVISISKPTPQWATNLFRLFYGISTAIAVWLAATKLIPDTNKFEILLAVSILDRVMWSFARVMGVKKDDCVPDTDFPK